MEVQFVMEKDNFGMSYCATDCPHERKANNRSESVIRVGSWHCHTCDAHKQTNLTTQIVSCREVSDGENRT